jgi:hypothetical protein
MCILLGAITPDHQKKRMPLEHYFRYTRSQHNRELYQRFHGRKR